MMRDIQKWHDKEHRPGPIETCWDCGRQKAKCRSKLFRYASWLDAHLDAQQMNEADGYIRPRAAYHCPWCGMYHHTTSLRGRRERVKKQQRKWMIKQELERRSRESQIVNRS